MSESALCDPAPEGNVDLWQLQLQLCPCQPSNPKSRKSHPDVALVARAKKGDTAAFEQFGTQYERQIFRVAQHITQNRETRKNITQDAFFKAYEKLEAVPGELEVLHLAGAIA